MIKITALLITSLSGGAFGLLLCKEEKARIDKIYQLLSFISYIHWSIENKSVPLSQVLSDYRSETEDNDYKRVEFINALSSSRGGIGDKILEASKGVFTSASMREINEFSRTLGTLDKETQLKKAEKVIKILESELSDSREEYASKGKMYKMIPFLFSCVVALLLL